MEKVTLLFVLSFLITVTSCVKDDDIVTNDPVNRDIHVVATSESIEGFVVRYLLKDHKEYSTDTHRIAKPYTRTFKEFDLHLHNNNKVNFQATKLNPLDDSSKICIAACFDMLDCDDIVLSNCADTTYINYHLRVMSFGE